MVDIALVSCNDHETKIDANRQNLPNLGLYHLKGALSDQGLESRIFNLYGASDDALRALPKSIQESGAKAIGLSATALNADFLEVTAKMIRGETDLPIVAGGFVWLVGQEIIQSPAIDAIVKGEGEETAPSVFHAFIHDQMDALGSTPGILYKHNGQIIDTGKPARVRDLSKYTPELSYIAGQEDRIDLSTSRGCYHACDFCGILLHLGRGITELPKEKKIALIHEAMKRNPGAGSIFFHDDEFLFRPGRIKELAEVLEEYNLKITFETRANDILAPEIRKELLQHRHLIEHVNIGIESFSNSQLIRYKKGITAQQNLEAIKWLTGAQIIYRSYFMFIDDHTTTQELKENIEGLLQMPHQRSCYLPVICCLTKAEHAFTIRHRRDLRGNSNPPENIRTFQRLYRDSREELDLQGTYNHAFLNADGDLANCLILTARALLSSAVLAASEASYSTEAEERHVALREAVKKADLLDHCDHRDGSRNKKARAGIDKWSLEHFSWIFKRYDPPMGEIFVKELESIN